MEAIKLFVGVLVLITSLVPTDAQNVALMTLGQQTLIRVRDENFAVVNLVGRNYVAVARNGNQVVQTRADCSQIRKSFHVMSNEEREELDGIFQGISREFEAPVQRTRDQFKYKLDLNRLAPPAEPQRWVLSNFGQRVSSQVQPHNGRLFEIVQDIVSLSSTRLQDLGSISRIFFVGQIVVKLLVNGELGASPLHCIRDPLGSLLRQILDNVIRKRDRVLEVYQRREEYLTRIRSMHLALIGNARGQFTLGLHGARERARRRLNLLSGEMENVSSEGEVSSSDDSSHSSVPLGAAPTDFGANRGDIASSSRRPEASSDDSQ